jgi:hypothetical protein
MLISSVKLICYWFSQAFLLNHRAIDLWLSAQRILFPHFSISIGKGCLIVNTNTWTSIKVPLHVQFANTLTFSSDDPQGV